MRALKTNDLRRELHDAAPVLLHIASNGIEGERLIEDGILSALREVSLRYVDPSLEEVVAAGGLAEDPLVHVATWAQSLDFGQLVPDSILEQVEETASDPVAEQRPNLERWLVRVSFPNFKSCDSWLLT